VENLSAVLFYIYFASILNAQFLFPCPLPHSKQTKNRNQSYAEGEKDVRGLRTSLPKLSPI
jgi:hypothetical protein